MQLAQAQQHPISSHGGTRPRTYGLVLHVQVGNGSLANYFANPNNNVSSAYWLAKDGRIEQYYDDALIGWTQADGNSSWIAVETEGYVEEPLTEAQLNGMAVLLYLTSQEYGFPIRNTDDVNGRGLGHHAMGGVAWGNHPCPGPARIAQKDEIVRRAQSISANGISSAALGGTQLSEEDDMFSDEDRANLQNTINAVGLLVSVWGPQVVDPLAATKTQLEAMAGQQTTIANNLLDPNGGVMVMLARLTAEVAGIKVTAAGETDPAVVEAAVRDALADLTLVLKASA